MLMADLRVKGAEMKPSMSKAIFIILGPIVFVPTSCPAVGDWQINTDTSALGNWLPADPPTQNQVRPLACWYEGAKLVASQEITNGAVLIGSNRWTCNMQEPPVAGEPDVRELTAPFKLAEGAEKSAGIALGYTAFLRGPHIHYASGAKWNLARRQNRRHHAVGSFIRA